MKILVTGAKGQLGWKIKELLSKDFQLVLTDKEKLDITKKLEVSRVIKSEKPDVIIHAAAYTKVDEAEVDKALCRKINALGTKNIAEIADEIGATLVYISTDYVFDGKREKPYNEHQTTHPLSVYGKTKLEGEKFIQKICQKYYIIRSAWIFGELPKNYHGGNFVETMLKLAKEKNHLNIVNDQTGSPTYTGDLVNVINQIVKSEKLKVKRNKEKKLSNFQLSTFNLPYGIYNFSGKGECSWYDFAKEIFCQAKINVDIRPIKSSEYPQKAKRPVYSYLDKTKIEKALNFKTRSWQEMLRDYLKNRKN